MPIVLDRRAVFGAAAAVPYIGGKSQAGVWQWIVNLMPPHPRFFELFAGSAAITRLKRPAAETFLIEKSERQAAVLRATMPDEINVTRDDGVKWATAHPWRPDDLIYCDPPYVLATRKFRTYYDHELPDEQHVELLDAMIRCPGRVMLSGYASELYARHGFGAPAELLTAPETARGPCLPGWRVETFKTHTRMHRPAVECLWMNYPRPTELHDLRRVGENFRQRWRIEKRRRRWRARLEKMPPLERATLFSALLDVMQGEAKPSAAASAENGASGS